MGNTNLSKFWVQIFLLMPLLVVIVGVEPAFALNVPDTAPWTGSNTNYAAVSVHTICGAGNDDDDDGICNNWEDQASVTGLDINFHDTSVSPNNDVNYRYHLSCDPSATYLSDPAGDQVCPQRNIKDVYVELDWMHGHDVSATAIKDVTDAYNRMGIHLHILMGEHPSVDGDIGVHYCVVKNVLANSGTPLTSCTNNPPIPATVYQSYPWLKQNFFGTVNERPGVTTPNTSICPNDGFPQSSTLISAFGSNESKKLSYNCLTAKRQVFHYALVANYQWGNIPSSGWAEIMGNDVLITLGNFANGVGNIDNQEGSLMHELGHNYGLNHGGAGDSTNCKPNYLSVMNYLYQFRTNDQCRPLDYSNKALTNLNEASLSDSNIGSSPYPLYNPTSGPDGQKQSNGNACPNDGTTQRNIFWTPQTVSPGTAGVTNDWNNNGIGTSPEPYTQILNNFGGICSYSTAITLTGFNDTDLILHGNVNFPHPLVFRTNSNFYQGTPSGDNVTSDEVGTGDNHADAGPVLVSTSPPIPNNCPEGQTCQPPQVSPPVVSPSTQTCNSNCCGCETMSIGLIIGLLIAILIIVIIILLLRKRP